MGAGGAAGLKNRRTVWLSRHARDILGDGSVKQFYSLRNEPNMRAETSDPND